MSKVEGFAAAPEHLIVGSGIDGLMNAYMLHLQDKTASIKIITRNSDPRKVAKNNLGFYRDSEAVDGSTWEGLLNRFVTDFEGQNYNGNSAVYPDMDFVFSNLVTQGGWLGKPLSECSLEEKDWLATRITACHKSNAEFNKDLFDLYVKYNQSSLSVWVKMRKDHPELFENVDVISGVIKVCNSEEVFESLRTLHEDNNALAEGHGALSANDSADLEIIKKSYPHFYDAIKRGFIKGGILRMNQTRSFTFNIHIFCENLLNYLETSGVEIQFDSEVNNIKASDKGEIIGLRVSCKYASKKSYVVEAKNIVISAGAYAGSLLDRTSTEHKLNAIVGGWVTLPAPDGIKQSFKLHTDRYSITDDGEIRNYSDLPGADRMKIPKDSLRTVIDQNHKVIERGGRKYIVMGGGYAWVGSDPRSVSLEQANAMREENLRIVRECYGEHFDQAFAAGEVEYFDRVCARSFTANDVPLFSISSTSRGGKLIINGGMNTGTTTAAPMTGKIISNIVNHTDDSAADDLLCKIKELDSRWKEFITDGEGKNILKENKRVMA